MNRKSRTFLAATFVAISLCTLAVGQVARQSGKAASHSSETSVARGKYIVEGVAICGQCHTPRDAANNPDRSHWLEGAAVWLRPAQPVEDWPLQAPRIAGNPPGTDAEMVKLLTTGIWRDGEALASSNAAIRMTRQDAESVVAYLKSLKPEPK